MCKMGDVNSVAKRYLVCGNSMSKLLHFSLPRYLTALLSLRAVAKQSHVGLLRDFVPRNDNNNGSRSKIQSFGKRGLLV